MAKMGRPLKDNTLAWSILDASGPNKISAIQIARICGVHRNTAIKWRQGWLMKRAEERRDCAVIMPLE